ncbi:MAG: hypothetical protein ACO239_00460 [Sediminibacterium sp.]
MANRLNVTELDFDTIKTNLKAFLRNQSEFTDYDFEGSGLNVLLDVLAYNTHYNAYYLNMLANESFLDSSILRNSVVSHAKKFGYTPRSVSAPVATINLSIDSGSSTSGTLTLPKGYVFLSELIDNKLYNFVTIEDVTVSKTANNFVFSNLKIYEGQLKDFSFSQNDASNPKQIFTIPDSNIDTTTLTVSIQQSPSNNDTTVYTLNTDIMSVINTSEVYYLQEGNDGKYQIYFGDDILGKKIPDGGIVNVSYLNTNGSSANKANNFVGTSRVGGYSNFTITSITSAAGGAERENVDQIKFAAPLQYTSQNRAVTKNDYIKIIQQRYPQFEAVNVWGGEENTPPIYGKVFISAKPRLGFDITQAEKEYIKEQILKPISVMTVTPEIVDVDYNYIKFNSTIYYDPTKSSLNSNNLTTLVTTKITDFCSSNLNKFNSIFKASHLKTEIDSLNKSFLSNEIDLFLSKRFRPDLINSDNYVLDFGVELDKGTTVDNLYSSPEFTALDEEGISRQCFIEEVPSSFTGIEAVTITNPGLNYTTTPLIEIIGDGEGASASAVIVNGKLESIKITNPGVGYTTASIRILGGGGQFAAASAVLEGRYGQIRIYYYKPDEITNDNTKVILNKSKNNGIMGTIDYKLGKIYINEFNPLDISNDFKELSINIRPKNSIISSSQNKMLVFDETDPTSVVVDLIKV